MSINNKSNTKIVSHSKSSKPKEDQHDLLTFSNLPYDLHYAFFQHFSNSNDIVTSVCLGLTSKYFYTIQCKFHKTPIWLREYVFTKKEKIEVIPLHQLLRKWMGRHLRFTFYEVDKFVTMKRWRELERFEREEKRWNDGWESC